MIILYTGSPGSGKTASVVLRLLSSEFKGRKIYTNIRGLCVPNYEIFPVPDIKTLPSTCESGDLFILDECQNFYPQRGKDSVPDYISWFSEHRHSEVDFILMTQHPMLLDVYIRRLINQHNHIVKSAVAFSRPVQFTWDEYKEDVKDRYFSEKRILNYSPAYPYYLSTKTGRHSGAVVAKSFKPILYIGLAFSFVFGGIYYAYYTYEHSHAKQMMGEAGKNKTLNGDVEDLKPLRGFVADYKKPLLPVLPQLPMTAAAASMDKPGIASCVASSRNCVCYGDMGTRLNPAVPDAFCRDYAEHGLPPQLNQPRLAQAQIETSKQLQKDDGGGKSAAAAPLPVSNLPPVQPMHWETNVVNTKDL